MTITNTNYVFDLDAHIVKNKHLLDNLQDKNEAMKRNQESNKPESVQIDLLESTDQIYSLDNFINTGMALTYIVNNEKRSKENEKDFPLQ